MELVGRAYPATSTCTYRLYDSTDRLLYVGVAADFDKRFYQHKRTKKWWPLVAHRDITWFTNRIDAMYEEARAIANEAPQFNEKPGIHPIGLMIVDRFVEQRHGYHVDAREITVSAFGKDSIFRDIGTSHVDAVVAIEAEPVGVVMSMRRYLAACEALGEDPQAHAAGSRIDAADLIG